MSMEYVVKIHRLDRRCKTGERLVGTYDFDRKTDKQMQREVNSLYLHHYPQAQYRIEFAPKFKTVKSLMSGKSVQIAADTPRCCDPSSELYWSM